MSGPGRGGRFLPMSREEMDAVGWDRCDVIIISGDAYVDHPSFGVAIIGRVLENVGYRVGIIAQPEVADKKAFVKLGEPGLCFCVTSGNVDSMVNNYTANKRMRSDDDYSPGGRPRLRPDRAVTVYCNKLRESFRETPVIIGGIEASLRRFAHYDYWDDKVRQSILADAPADMIIYGMGEKAIVDVVGRLRRGEPISSIRQVRGVSYKTRSVDDLTDYVDLPDFRTVSVDRRMYAQAFRQYSDEQDPFCGRVVVQRHPKSIIVQNPPSEPLTADEMDAVYDLPYTRSQHPSYTESIPGLRTVQFSITSHRGCFGGCAFCAITNHQGRVVQSRSRESIIREVTMITKMPGFRGIISDIGGPTADMYMLGCSKQATQGMCSDRMCLYPEPCPNLDRDHSQLIALLEEVRKVPGVRKVFIGSGIRYDLAMQDESYLRQICRQNISGQLKVAPEHVSKQVTDAMCKPSIETYNKFVRRYSEINRQLGKEQYIIPYFISAHPGCTLRDAIMLAEYVRDMGYQIEQVQDFTPTPSTLSTCMYYTGYNPYTQKDVYVPSGIEERRMHRALLQYKNPENYDLVKKALIRANRKDLIGYGPKCLIAPVKPAVWRSRVKKR
ncbi:MAG TPA: YgiQ family radical SAM protein [Methanocella sp.]|nr:YgiQ family radical SAM protein [Methanocella sp.]